MKKQYLVSIKYLAFPKQQQPDNNDNNDNNDNPDNLDNLDNPDNNDNKSPLTMKKILLTITILAITATVFSQSVTNIVPAVVNDKIQIGYTLSGVKYFQEVTSVKVYVSINGGDFTGPLKKVEGDVSEGVKNGKHIITWDVLKEIPFTDEDLVFKIKVKVADKDRSKSMFVMLAGNDVTPFGIRIGMLGKTAWYVEARGSLLAMQNPNYTFGNEGSITGYDKPGYYQFTGTAGWQAYSLLVGVTKQISWNTFLYAGAGYGVENYIMEFNEYDYSQSTSTGTEWAKDENYSNSGVEIDAGLILRFNKFVVGAGGTSLNFKSYGWTASLGYSF